MAKPKRALNARHKAALKMAGKTKLQQAEEKAEQARKLRKIQDAASRKGQRMAARMVAQREGFEAGIASITGTAKPKRKHKGPW